MKVQALKLYNYQQSKPDSSSDTEWSDGEDLYTPLLQQDTWVISDTDGDIPSNGYYLVIPASDDEITSEDEDDVPLSRRISRLVNIKYKKTMEAKTVWLGRGMTQPGTITFTGDTLLPENILSLTDPDQHLYNI